MADPLIEGDAVLLSSFESASDATSPSLLPCRGLCLISNGKTDHARQDHTGMYPPDLGSLTTCGDDLTAPSRIGGVDSPSRMKRHYEARWEVPHPNSDRRRVLVFVPHFNCAGLLADALRSLENQTLLPDILVIDDHSITDEWTIVRSYAGPRVQVLRTRSQNSGPAALSNDAFGIAAELGYEYLARMDADDISYPRRLELQVQFLDTHTNLIACGTNCDYLDPALGRIGSSTVPSSPVLVRREALAGLRGTVQGSLLFRMNAMGALRYDESLKSAEDTDFILQLTQGGLVANLPETCYGIRLRANSLSTRSAVEHVSNHFFVLDRYRRNLAGSPARTYHEFLRDRRIRSAIQREITFLEAWRRGLESRNRFALVRAALFSPKRIIARALRMAEAAFV